MIDDSVPRRYRTAAMHSESIPLAARADGALARAVSAADTEEASAAETELYRRFAPRVRLFGLKHLSDRAAAEDLAQQVMLVVISRLRAGQVRDPDQVGSFVLGTSRMMAAGLRRVERRRAALHLRFDSPDERVYANDLSLDATRIAPCLAAIRERERTILLLTYYAERSASEIADALGSTPGAVRVGRHRALAAMRECIEGGKTS